MSEDDKELFGKIDALFEKRAPDALVDKGLEHEDFPVLTEVVATPTEPAAVPVAFSEPERRVMDRRVVDHRKGDRRVADRRLGDRRRANQPPAPPPRPVASNQEVERLVQAVEQRLADLFIRQQLRMEDAVRKVIRDEIETNLEKYAPRRTEPPADDVAQT